MLKRNLRMSLGIAMLASAMAQGKAHADSTCVTLMKTITDQLRLRGGVFDFELVVHQSDITLTTYSEGQLRFDQNADPVFTVSGNATRLWSTRKNGNQPFNINAPNTITVFLDPNGTLGIIDRATSTGSAWDMTCFGKTFWFKLDRLGVASLVVRDFHL